MQKYPFASFFPAVFPLNISESERPQFTGSTSTADIRQLPKWQSSLFCRQTAARARNRARAQADTQTGKREPRN